MGSISFTQFYSNLSIFFIISLLSPVTITKEKCFQSHKATFLFLWIPQMMFDSAQST